MADSSDQAKPNDDNNKRGNDSPHASSNLSLMLMFAKKAHHGLRSPRHTETMLGTRSRGHSG